MSAERYPGGHNPSMDEGFAVEEPATYDDDFVATCAKCGWVYRARPVPRVGQYDSGWEASLDRLWNHREEHRAMEWSAPHR